jgi:hypothetical protein
MRALLERLNVGAGRDHVALINEITNFRLTQLTGDTCLNNYRSRTFNRGRTRGDNHSSNGI